MLPGQVIHGANPETVCSHESVMLVLELLAEVATGLRLKC